MSLKPPIAQTMRFRVFSEQKEARDLEIQTVNGPETDSEPSFESSSHDRPTVLLAHATGHAQGPCRFVDAHPTVALKDKIHGFPYNRRNEG